MKVMIFTL